ncbi:MAG: hypothetical protein OEU90_03100 [Gammaproteobacteria bacterium]|nr:hypothetical protein [Gammaproteobacteria bacterium]MDH3750883.1 hypothetical protein [Gammaproteobacteria bacterium]MDH3804440.1 hypothetical protein [Gammaproteobacteria bacterium]
MSKYHQMEITTMEDQRTCNRCGSTRFSEGSIQSTGKMYFRLRETKFFAAKTADLEVNGSLCLECGSIDLIGDVEKARSLLKTA